MNDPTGQQQETTSSSGGGYEPTDEDYMLTEWYSSELEATASRFVRARVVKLERKRTKELKCNLEELARQLADEKKFNAHKSMQAINDALQADSDDDGSETEVETANRRTGKKAGKRGSSEVGDGGVGENGDDSDADNDDNDDDDEDDDEDVDSQLANNSTGTRRKKPRALTHELERVRKTFEKAKRATDATKEASTCARVFQLTSSAQCASHVCPMCLIKLIVLNHAPVPKQYLSYSSPIPHGIYKYLHMLYRCPECAEQLTTTISIDQCTPMDAYSQDLSVNAGACRSA
jgi:hypothetical protein